jgi:hypothetical protein
MLRAGGWGIGLISVCHVALHDGSAGTQFLARSVSRTATAVTKNINKIN